MLKDFEVIDIRKSRNGATMTIMPTRIKFNYGVIQDLEYPKNVRMLLNVATHEVAIQECKETDINSFSFDTEIGEKKRNYPVSVNVRAIHNAIRKMMSWDENPETVYIVEGEHYPDDKAIVFNLKEAKSQVKRGRKAKSEEQSEES